MSNYPRLLHDVNMLGANIINDPEGGTANFDNKNNVTIVTSSAPTLPTTVQYGTECLVTSDESGDSFTIEGKTCDNSNAVHCIYGVTGWVSLAQPK